MEFLRAPNPSKGAMYSINQLGKGNLSVKGQFLNKCNDVSLYLRYVVVKCIFDFVKH